MDCLTDTKIQEYIDGALNRVESAMVRDHIIVCAACRKEYEYFEKLEKQLLHPVEIIPPPIIERHVLKTLFPMLPTYSSIIGLIAASFLLLVTWIYIYFDFANNSLIQAFRLTSRDASNFIGSIIEGISAVFSAVFTIFKVLNRFLDILVGVDLGAEMIGLAIFTFLALVFYWIYKAAFKKLRIKDKG